MKKLLDKAFHRLMMSDHVTRVLVQLLIDVNDHLEKVKEYHASKAMKEKEEQEPTHH